LLRDHVASPDPGAGENKKLFLDAADALDQRASKLTETKRPSLRLVDITV
jgi:hypothetical protein